MVENVDRYGLRVRGSSARAGCASTGPGDLDLGAGFQPGPAQNEIIAQFNEAARKNTENGAEVVIAAGGVVMALLAHAGIPASEDGVPILNGITNLVKLGEAAVKLDRIMGGRFVSKQMRLRAASADQIATSPEALW